MAKKDFLTNYKLLYNINEKDESYVYWFKQMKEIITFTNEFAIWY